MPCKILTYGQIDRTDWSRLVRESGTGTWFQTPEAYDFFASMQELFYPFAIAVINNGHLRGVCAGYITRETNPIRQFFTRRAIIIGGPALADDATDAEVAALMNAVREEIKHNVIYIETRNFNDYSRWRSAFEKADFAYQLHLNFHVDCTDKDAMWERLSDNRKRQIKKQPARNLLVGKAHNEQDVREWYVILKELYRKKVKTPLWPVEFFIEAYRQGVGQFLMVRHEGKIIGGSMLVEDGKAVYEWFECGLNAEYKEQYPSVTVTYAGMQHANVHGIPRYDMMGAGVPDVPYGVRDFKAEFGGTMVEHGRWHYISRPFLYRLGKWVVKMQK